MNNSIFRLGAISFVLVMLTMSQVQAAAAIIASNNIAAANMEYQIEDNGYVSAEQMNTKYDSYYVIPVESWGRGKVDRLKSDVDVTEMVACLPGFEYISEQCQVIGKSDKIVSRPALTPKEYVDIRSDGHAEWVGVGFTKVVKRKYNNVRSTTSLILFYTLNEVPPSNRN